MIHVTCQCRDFNPRPPCGGRRHGSQGRDGRLYTFQSTPSVWRETGHGQQDCRPYPISIHSLRVEGDRRILTMQEEGAISIHSLRVEGDKYRLTVSGGGKISIHSLRVEGDASAQQQRCTRALFQSTPSVWRETNILQLAITHIVFQSTPSVWRETPLTRIGFRVCVFQSTPSVWRETKAKHTKTKTEGISIHSLRVEGDRGKAYSNATISNFNPLPPCGGRL